MSRFSSFELPIVADVVPESTLKYSINGVVLPPDCVPIRSFPLADPAFANNPVNVPAPDILLGAEYFESCMLNNTEKVGTLHLRQSLFGWLVIGPVEHVNNKPAISLPLCLTICQIESQLRKFCELEEVEAPIELLTDEKKRCDEHFEATHSRHTDGKFVTKLPKRESPDTLVYNLATASRQLCWSERHRDPLVEPEYCKFMGEYEDLSHMTEVTEFNRLPTKYFIPHHAVIRPESSTTRTRVVFNASSKTASGVSLNDILMVGPTLQPDLFDTLLKFRQHRVAFTADITKMYRCIWVHPQDRPLQCILWRKSPTEPIRQYQLNTLTYGTAPASFIATKCLLKLSQSIPHWPSASLAISSHFYMDDLLSGASSLEECIELQAQIHSTLESAGFILRKYQSNATELIQRLTPELRATECSVELTGEATTSVLGVYWKAASDSFGLRVNKSSCPPEPLTRRSLLSEISRTFDPLGFAAPFTIRAKLFMQRIWAQSSSWDEPLSPQLALDFSAYWQEIQSLEKFQIPRPYCSFTSSVSAELVGFCDASEVACYAVVYIRFRDAAGQIDVNFVCSKTRVAPLKPVSIPRLELQAAWLLAQLVNRISRVLVLPVSNVKAFTDSKVVLAWLAKPPSTWTIFVRNRVAKISEFLPRDQWSYVCSSQNPADLATRGVSVNKFLKSNLWTTGPSFLLTEFVPLSVSDDTELEKRQTKVVCKQKPPTPPKPVQYQPVNYKRLIDAKFETSPLLQLDETNYDSSLDRSLTDESAPLIDLDIDCHTSPAGRIKPPLLPKPLNIPPKLPAEPEKRNTNPFRQEEASDEPNANLGNGTNPFHPNRRSTNPFDFLIDVQQVLPETNNNFDLLIAEKYQNQQLQETQNQLKLVHEYQQPLQELAQEHFVQQHILQHQHLQQVNRVIEFHRQVTQRQIEVEGSNLVCNQQPLQNHQSRLSLSTSNLVASLDDIHKQFNSDKECLIEKDYSSYSRYAKKHFEQETAKSNRSSWKSNCSDLENGDGSLSRSSSIAENDHGWLKVSPRSSSSGGSPVVKSKVAKDEHLPGESVDDEAAENSSSENSYSVRRRIKTWFGSFGKGTKGSKRRDSTFYVEQNEAGKMWDRASVSSGEERNPEEQTGDEDAQHGSGHELENGTAQPMSERERKERKAFLVIQELISSEKVFIDVLKLVTQDFVSYCRSIDPDNPIIHEADMNKIINTLPQLKCFNEALLEDLEERFGNWQIEPRIADIIVKKGPFLKLFSTYIKNFEKQCYYLDEFSHKYSRFGKAVKDFEASERCKKLTLKHYMLKPVQRLPQYRLLLEDYLSHQYPDSIDYENTEQALKIVCEVADHANRSVQQGVHLSKLLQLQSRLGNYEIIKPGREFVKEGELYKYSRKETHQRYFILLNDCLLYTSYYGSMFSLTVKHKLPLAGMKVCIPKIEDYNNEFNIMSTTRSFTLRARSPEERDEWVSVLEKTIKEHNRKQLSFSPKFEPQNLEAQPLEIGKQAPVWIPDNRVTMCQVCTAEFKVTFRRHHCRACGKVVCGNCSDNKAPLQYRTFSAARVCDDCYKYLLKEFGDSKAEMMKIIQTLMNLNDVDVLLMYDTIGSTFKKHDPHSSKKSLQKYIPTRLKEVPANVCGVQSGWLHRKGHKSWKRFWFVLKEQVLYVYKASEDVKALETIPVLGYIVETFKESCSSYEDIDSKLVFQLAHAGQSPLVFYADTEAMADRWIGALQDAVSIS